MNLHEIYIFYIKVTTENITDFAQFDYRFHMEMTGFVGKTTDLQ